MLLTEIAEEKANALFKTTDLKTNRKRKEKQNKKANKKTKDVQIRLRLFPQKTTS